MQMGQKHRKDARHCCLPWWDTATAKVATGMKKLGSCWAQDPKQQLLYKTIWQFLTGKQWHKPRNPDPTYSPTDRRRTPTKTCFPYLQECCSKWPKVGEHKCPPTAGWINKTRHVLGWSIIWQEEMKNWYISHKTNMLCRRCQSQRTIHWIVPSEIHRMGKYIERFD